MVRQTAIRSVWIVQREIFRLLAQSEYRASQVYRGNCTVVIWKTDEMKPTRKRWRKKKHNEMRRATTATTTTTAKSATRRSHNRNVRRTIRRCDTTNAYCGRDTPAASATFPFPKIIKWRWDRCGCVAEAPPKRDYYWSITQSRTSNNGHRTYHPIVDRYIAACLARRWWLMLGLVRLWESARHSATGAEVRARTHTVCCLFIIGIIYWFTPLFGLPLASWLARLTAVRLMSPRPRDGRRIHSFFLLSVEFITKRPLPTMSAQ